MRGVKTLTLSCAPVDYAHAFSGESRKDQQYKIIQVWNLLILWKFQSINFANIELIEWHHTYSCESGSSNTSNNNHKSNILLKFVFSSRALKFDSAELTFFSLTNICRGNNSDLVYIEHVTFPITTGYKFNKLITFIQFTFTPYIRLLVRFIRRIKQWYLS